MAAVEDHDLSAGRHLRMDAPEKIVVALDRRRRLEARDAHAEWIDGGKDVADGTILAGAVHALQHQQQLVGARGVEEILQLVQLLRERRKRLQSLALVLQSGGFAIGIESREPDFAPEPNRPEIAFGRHVESS